MLPWSSIWIYSYNPSRRSTSMRILAHLLSTFCSHPSSKATNFPILSPIASNICFFQNIMGKPCRMAHIFYMFYGSLLASNSTLQFFRINPEGPHCQLFSSNSRFSASVLTWNKIHHLDITWNIGSCRRRGLHFSSIHLQRVALSTVLLQNLPTKSSDRYSGTFVNDMSFPTINVAACFFSLAATLFLFSSFFDEVITAPSILLLKISCLSFFGVWSVRTVLLAFSTCEKMCIYPSERCSVIINPVITIMTLDFKP